MKQKQSTVSLKLKKAQGQLNRVVQMTEDGQYCINIIQQNLAVIGLLKAAQQELLEHHLHHCFKEAANNSKKQDVMIEELIKVINYYHK